MSTPNLNIEGRLTDAPELRYTQSGKAVVNFTIAASDRVQDKQGQWGDGDKLFLRCTAWNELAEHVATFGKGDPVWASGKLVTHEYENREGQKRSTIELTVFSFGPRFVPSKNAQTRQDAEPWAPGGSPAQGWTAPAAAEPDVWHMPASHAGDETPF